MLTLFYRQPRMTMLFVSLILVSGLSSYVLLPRMEDPLLTKRFSMITTQFPGADAERVEALVTEVIEESLREIDEIKELRSVSRGSISIVSIELRDDVYEADLIWSRIRDKVSDTTATLPAGVLEPEFDELNVKAYASILALTWDAQLATGEAPNYAILRRLADQLDDELKTVPGTEIVDTFGDPSEEILVEVDLPSIAGLGLTAADISRQIGASDAKASAGQFRGESDLLVEVGGEFDSIDRVASTPIRFDETGRFVTLSDIARVEKTMTQPFSNVAIVDGKPAVVLGVLVRPDARVDHWSDRIDATVNRFAATIPTGVSLRQVFRQNEYVSTRLKDLLKNLLFGGVGVAVVIFVMMGWRSALIVSSALPLSAFMVLSGMRFLGIPIHQMSVTGLIVALGLLIDNAIVVVDEVSTKIHDGQMPLDAVADSVRHLTVPLLGSTVTTALAFAPIALMPGPAGEFVGSIAVSVILAIFSSLFLALTIVPALTAFGIRSSRDDRPAAAGRWFNRGLTIEPLTRFYSASLDLAFRRPIFGTLIGVVLPVAGFVLARQIPEQFFPPADRDQVQIEVDLPSQASLAETTQIVESMREQLLENERVKSVTWFLGESAPSFYYNVIPRRRNTSSYAQALVQLVSTEDTRELIHELQEKLDAGHPGARVLVRQLEQGPPFDAPIEVRLFGPDKRVLRSLGEYIRATLSGVSSVTHTRSDFGEAVAKISLEIPEEEARMAGLSLSQIAGQLNDSLEGVVAGSILEGTEELPVRVRVSGGDRTNLSSIASTELVGNAQLHDGNAGVSLAALAEVKLIPESSVITRMNGRRMNEVQAYLSAGVLPAIAQAEFAQRLEDSNFSMPPGYTMEFGGEAAKRDDAVGNLLGSVGVLMVMMLATLVLSFSSFRMAAIIGAIAVLSAGLGMGSLWVFGYPFGFMVIVGTMGLIGVAINDAIVVLAAIREDEAARTGDPDAVRSVVLRSTRHVVATTLTTIAGFMPLVLGGGGFWPPLAVSIAGGVAGATILALYFAPAAYIALMCYSVAKPEVAT